MSGQVQRKNKIYLRCALAAFFFCASIAIHAADLSIEVQNSEAVNLKPLILAENDPRKATLFIFTTIDCPIANAYAPELERIHKEFAPQGVQMFLVQADPVVTPAAAKKHAQEFRLEMPVLLDPKHELVAYAQASVTPEAALFDRSGMLLYRGRIDNRFEGYGKDRVEPSVRDLRAALTVFLKGEKIEQPRAKAVGCLIGDLKPVERSRDK